jgi:hypothetical protein
MPFIDRVAFCTPTLTNEYVERFIKCYGNWDIKSQYENLQYVGRKLSNRTYYSGFVGFWVDDIVTKNTPARYGKNNHFTYAEQPTVIVQGSQRKINIYCAISAA